MVRVSVLNDALKSMYNADKRGKRQVKMKMGLPLQVILESLSMLTITELAKLWLN
ncbi:hypothetical protein Golob_009965 [Gossypium lobatum]|uniref:Uncharacterized protein n=1 Tax=Gossypium lobatum TaxID=34289 RepID=A0A7J8MK06_9ROSI|nr:hypothetical protein [Gossypium lobatum]